MKAVQRKWCRALTLFLSRHRALGEEGFTLIELLIVLVIMPMVIGAIAIIMITSLKATVPNDFHGHATDLQGTSERLAESHDTQITSTVFVRDVQNSVQLETNATPLCGTGTQRLGLTWATANGTAIQVSYSSTTIGGALTLVRSFCNGVSPAVSTTVSHDVNGATAPTTTFVCNTTIDPTSACNTDASSGLISTLRVDTVEVDVTESSGYLYRLVASPRQFRGSSALIAAAAPTLLLADGGNCGTGNVSVNGTAAVNYGSLSFQKTNGSFGAQQVYEAVQTVNDGVLQSGSDGVTSATGPFNASEVGEPISGTGIPAGTTIKSVSSATQAKMTNTATSSQTNDSISIGPNSAISPSGAYTGPTTTGAPLPDPYANLPAPSAGTDTYIESSLFNPAGPTIAPGLYVIQAGMKISGGTPISVGPALADGTDGVFFYVTGGSVKIGGSATITLSAITTGPWSSIYGGVLLYQVASDTSGMTLDGSAAATTLNGAIGAPGAAVTLNGGGNGTGLTAAGLEAGTLYCNGNNTSTLLGPPEATTTLLASSMNPSNNGSNVTFTATVVASGGVVPTGTVTFTETPNGSAVPVTMCSNVPLNASGIGTCATTTLVSAGSPYTINASYSPSAGLKASSQTLTQNVNAKTSTTTAVASNHDPSTTGQAVTYTATVTPTVPGALTGGVAFDDGATAIAGCGSQSLSGGPASWTATCTFTYNSAGSHSITAVYTGDTNFAGSTSSPLTQYVNAIHVSVLRGVSSGLGNNQKWTATVTITVDNSSNAPVTGVVVTGSWGTNGSGQSNSGCTTNAAGTCSFTTGSLTSSVASDTWTVAGLTVTGYVWDPTGPPADVADSVTVNQ